MLLLFLGMNQFRPFRPPWLAGEKKLKNWPKKFDKLKTKTNGNEAKLNSEVC